MTRKNFDLIVFDRDSTLMDRAAIIVKYIQAAARDLGLAIHDNKAAAHLIGLGLMEAIATGESRVSLNRTLHETNLPSVLYVT
jgi:phosphoglycolate phosphatase-like HAD superfamily hydrolase